LLDILLSLVVVIVGGGRDGGANNQLELVGCVWWWWEGEEAEAPEAPVEYWLVPKVKEWMGGSDV
jgi:hypothetical protein